MTDKGASGASAMAEGEGASAIEHAPADDAADVAPAQTGAMPAAAEATEAPNVAVVEHAEGKNDQFEEFVWQFEDRQRLQEKIDQFEAELSAKGLQIDEGSPRVLCDSQEGVSIESVSVLPAVDQDKFPITFKVKVKKAAPKSSSPQDAERKGKDAKEAEATGEVELITQAEAKKPQDAERKGKDAKEAEATGEVELIKDAERKGKDAKEAEATEEVELIIQDEKKIEEIEIQKKELGWGRFSNHLNQVAKYIWVPKSISLDGELANRIMKQFNLQKPNLVLRFESGFAHPLHLVDEEMFRSPFHTAGKYPMGDNNFDSIRKAVAESSKKAQKDIDNVMEGKIDKIDEKTMKAVNQILKRLVFRVVQAILGVASEQGVWIVIQRKASGLHVLLEEAVAASKSSKAVVMVIDCPFKKLYTDVEIKMKSTKTECSEENKRKLKSKVTKTINQVTILNQKMLEMKKPLDVKNPQMWWLTKVHDREHATEKDGKDIDFWAKTDSFDMKKGWTQTSSRHAGSEDCRWSQYTYRSGTHYIFLESEKETDFDISFFGAKGSVFLGGGSSTKVEIMQAMRLGQPCILLHHTGRATQQLHNVHHALKQHYNQKAGHATYATCITGGEGGKDCTNKTDWLNHLCAIAGVQVGKGQSCELDYSDIVAMDSLYQQRHHIITDTCVALDPLDKKVSEASILKSVSQCFAANFRISTTVAYETSSRRAVANAWQLHAQLCMSCESQKVASDVSLLIVLVLGFLTLTLAILILEITREASGLEVAFLNFTFKKGKTVYNTAELCVIILPAVSGLINTLSARMRFRETWGLMKSAASLIEAEIFKFRVRVREYSVVGAGAAGMDRNAREKYVRDYFTSKVNFIFHSYLSEINGASLKASIETSEVPGYAASAGIFSVGDVGFTIFKSGKRKKTAKILKNASTRTMDESMQKQWAEDLENTLKQGLQITLDAHKYFADEEDKHRRDRKVLEEALNSVHLGNMSADLYYKERMLTGLDTLTVEAAKLKRYTFWGEVIVAASAVLASICGALAGTEKTKKFGSLVPICVAVGAIVTSMMQQHAFYARLTAANVAVRIMSKLDMQWNAASPLEQCSLPKISEMVSESERLRLNVVTAWTGVTQKNSSDKSSAQNASTEKQGDDADDKA